MNAVGYNMKWVYFSISLLAVFASLFALLDQTIYAARLNEITLYELQAQDMVTLAASLACLVCALAWNGTSKFINIVILGFVSYLLYIYAYFSFSIISSRLYIVYLLIFSLSFYVLIVQVVRMHRTGNYLQRNSRYPRKAISFFFIAVVAMMLVLEIPYMVEQTIVKNTRIAPFDVYCLLDLGIVFPGMIIVAVLNLRKNQFSSIWAGIVIVKTLTLMPALLLNDLFLWLHTGKTADISFDIAAAVFTIGTATLLVMYRRGTTETAAT